MYSSGPLPNRNVKTHAHNSILRTCFQIFILTSGRFVSRAEGEGYNPTSLNNNLETGTYHILHAEGT